MYGRLQVEPPLLLSISKLFALHTGISGLWLVPYHGYYLFLFKKVLRVEGLVVLPGQTAVP